MKKSFKEWCEDKDLQKKYLKKGSNKHSEKTRFPLISIDTEFSDRKACTFSESRNAKGLTLKKPRQNRNIRKSNIKHKSERQTSPISPYSITDEFKYSTFPRRPPKSKTKVCKSPQIPPLKLFKEKGINCSSEQRKKRKDQLTQAYLRIPPTIKLLRRRKQIQRFKKHYQHGKAITSEQINEVAFDLKNLGDKVITIIFTKTDIKQDIRLTFNVFTILRWRREFHSISGSLGNVHTFETALSGLDYNSMIPLINNMLDDESRYDYQKAIKIFSFIKRKNIFCKNKSVFIKFVQKLYIWCELILKDIRMKEARKIKCLKEQPSFKVSSDPNEKQAEQGKPLEEDGHQVSLLSFRLQSEHIFETKSSKSDLNKGKVECANGNIPNDMHCPDSASQRYTEEEESVHPSPHSQESVQNPERTTTADEYGVEIGDKFSSFGTVESNQEVCESVVSCNDSVINEVIEDNNKKNSNTEIQSSTSPVCEHGEIASHSSDFDQDAADSFCSSFASSMASKHCKHQNDSTNGGNTMSSIAPDDEECKRTGSFTQSHSTEEGNTMRPITPDDEECKRAGSFDQSDGTEGGNTMKSNTSANEEGQRTGSFTQSHNTEESNSVRSIVPGDEECKRTDSCTQSQGSFFSEDEINQTEASKTQFSCGDRNRSGIATEIATVDSRSEASHPCVEDKEGTFKEELLMAKSIQDATLEENGTCNVEVYPEGSEAQLEFETLPQVMLPSARSIPTVENDTGIVLVVGRKVADEIIASTIMMVIHSTTGLY